MTGPVKTGHIRMIYIYSTYACVITIGCILYSYYTIYVVSNVHNALSYTSHIVAFILRLSSTILTYTTSSLDEFSWREISL